jgi:ketosteroid isomerase-like protein
VVLSPGAGGDVTHRRAIVTGFGSCRPWLLATLLILLSMAGRPAAQGAEVPPTVDLPPALGRVLKDYEAAWTARDAGALARLFTDDGYVLPNGHPPVRGREAIERFYTGRGGELSLRAFAFALEGDVAYILGGYTTAPGQPDLGKFTLTLRRTDRRWLIVSDMDSGNQRR